MKKKTKVIIGCVVGFLAVSTVYGLLGGGKDAPTVTPTPTPPSSQTAPPVTPPATPDASTAPSEPVAPLDPEVVIANAKDADNQLWQIVLSINGTTDKLGTAMQGDDMVALYDEAKNAKDHYSTFWGQADDVECAGIDAYKEAVQLYSSYCGDLPANVIKYLDKQEVKYLSNAKEDLADIATYAAQVSEARLQFLTNSGLPEDQIERILAGEE